MCLRILLMVALVLGTASLCFSESMEEFQKLKASDEKTGLIPKGGPRLIPKDVIIEGLKKDCQVTFQSDAILFHYGLAKLKEESMPNVQNTASAIKQALGDPELSQIKMYYVDGHTCSVGSDDNNCRLSWSRAQAMIDELVKAGVPREKMVPRGFGKTNPAHSNDTEATRMLNRRVVLKGDCPQTSSKDSAVPCQIKAASQSRRAPAQTEDSTTTTETIDTSELDAAIAELQSQMEEGMPAIAMPLPIPIGMLIPMGKSATEKPPLPPGFKRTGPEAALQRVDTSRQSGKSADGASTKEQKSSEGKAKELPRGFKKVE